MGRHKFGDVGGAVHADQVAEAGAHRGRLEAVGLAHNPRGHVAAVAPTHHSHALRVGHPLPDEPVHSPHDVAVVAVAPVLEVGPPEALAVTAAAARVGHEQHVALLHKSVQRIGAPARREAVAEHTRRPTVDHHQQRVALALLIVLGLHHQTLQVQPVLGAVAQQLSRGRGAGEVGVDGGELFQRAGGDIQPVDFRRSGRVGERQCQRAALGTQTKTVHHPHLVVATHRLVATRAHLQPEHPPGHALPGRVVEPLAVG